MPGQYQSCFCNERWILYWERERVKAALVHKKATNKEYNAAFQKLVDHQKSCPTCQERLLEMLEVSRNAVMPIWSENEQNSNTRR